MSKAATPAFYLLKVSQDGTWMARTPAGYDK
jgi:hypothetical protein